MSNLQVKIPDESDQLIFDCVSALDNLRSFSLLAGAGAGKTKCLETTLNHIKKNLRRELQLKSQKVAVITFTNAARDEILRRVEFNSLFEISTVHSFAWNLIKGFNFDICQVLKKILYGKIEQLESEQSRGRPSAASAQRAIDIDKAKMRLSALEEIKTFTYSPDSMNDDLESLNHSEVLNICADFLVNKELMVQLLVSQYPIIFVDESQDTEKSILQALINIAELKTKSFAIGLFGDSMQQIYSNGIAPFNAAIPEHWPRPNKLVNYRCPSRVVQLINTIRDEVDGVTQVARNQSSSGYVRLFIALSDSEKSRVETEVCKQMSVITSDSLWSDSTDGVKTLILEHHMAATRMGFEGILNIFKDSKYSQSLWNSEAMLVEFRFFKNYVLPLASADGFSAMHILKQAKSPLLSKESLKSNGVEQIIKIKNAVASFKQVATRKDSTNKEILEEIAKNNLFTIPKKLLIGLSSVNENSEAESFDAGGGKTTVWQALLGLPTAQFRPFFYYVDGLAPFDTHQGVKGLEFPRVLVLIDNNSQGFLFSYSKIFGEKELSKTDLTNHSEGKDSSIFRTKRLLYVTCSRARESLAILYYADNPEVVKSFAISSGWFDESEINLIN